MRSLSLAVSVALATSGCREAPAVLEPGPEHYPQIGGQRELVLGVSATQAPLQNLDFDLDAWLDEVQAAGLDHVLVWSFMAIRQKQDGSVVDPRWGSVRPDLGPWARPEGESLAHDGRPVWDLTRFDERYWARLERLVAETKARGVRLWLTVFDGWAKGDAFAYHPFNRVNGGPLAAASDFVVLERYGRELEEPPSGEATWPRRNQWIQERFAERIAQTVRGSEHVVIEVFNEGEWYDAAQLQQHQEHFLRFFSARTDVPLAVNEDHLRTPAFDAWSRPEIDIVTFHSKGFDPDALYRRWSKAYTRTPTKPVVNTETVPAFSGEGEGEVSSDEVRRLVWATALAGGHVLVQDDSAFAFDPVAPRWEGAAMRRQLGIAAAFLCGRVDPTRGLAPVPDAVPGGLAALDPGLRWIVYLPDGGPAALSVERTGRYGVVCLDPVSGRTQRVEASAAAGALEVQCPWVGEAVVDVSLLDPAVGARGDAPR